MKALRDRVAGWFRLWNIDLPPDLEIVPNDRLRTSRGRCSAAEARIEIRPDILAAEALDETLCHEAAHLAVTLTTPEAAPHGPEWQRLVKLAGFEVKTKERATAPLSPRASQRGERGRGEGRDEERRTQNSERRTLKQDEEYAADSFQRSTFCVLRSAFDGCPFCAPDPERIFLDTREVLGIWDAFPVSPGHALLVPRRHVSTWFDATAQEREALTEATILAKQEIEKTHAPDGYNIGINSGAAAGQSVFHLHVHVIPRYSGDVPNPRGGIRGVIPSKQNYKTSERSEDVFPSPDGRGVRGEGRLRQTVETSASPSPDGRGARGEGRFTRGFEDDALLTKLEEGLARNTHASLAVAFTLTRGVDLLLPHLQDLLARGGRLRFLTGDYQGATEPEALYKLLDLEGDVELRVFETAKDHPKLKDRTHLDRAFHPKSYILQRDGGEGEAFVGSSNISESALRHGVA